MNIAKMMKQAQEMQAKLGQLQADIEVREFEGTAGGGAVKVVLTGKGELRQVVLGDGALDDKETLEDLIVLAHRDAKAKGDAAMADAMGSVTGGMNLPAGLKLPF
jgi:DNA-binding YbaB/EbfC family protein